MFSDPFWTIAKSRLSSSGINRDVRYGSLQPITSHDNYLLLKAGENTDNLQLQFITCSLCTPRSRKKSQDVVSGAGVLHHEHSNGMLHFFFFFILKRCIPPHTVSECVHAVLLGPWKQFDFILLALFISYKSIIGPIIYQSDTVYISCILSNLYVLLHIHRAK